MDHAMACRDKRDARIHTDWPTEVQQTTLAQIRTGRRAMIEGPPVKPWRHMA